MKTKAGKHRYYNVMYNWGREYPRIVGGQHETKEDAREELSEARNQTGIKKPCHVWIEGFEKDQFGNVIRIEA